MRLCDVHNQLKALKTSFSFGTNITLDDGYKISIGDRVVYSPSVTSYNYHDNNSDVKLIMGPIRSGKSTASCAEIVRLACRMQPCKDEVRRLRVAVIRNTYPDLQTTTVKTWQDWWGRLGIVETRFDSPIEFRHKFNDGKGDVELLIWFLALDKEKDIRKLLSLEVTFAYCNELRELPHAVFMHLRGRVGQYPRKCDLCGDSVDYWHGILADTNPPDTDHWLYKIFEVDKPPIYSLFKQPPALIRDDEGKWVLNKFAENTNNLPFNYYQNLMVGTTEEYQKVYVLGEYGIVFDGKPVYPSYNDSLHSVDDIGSVDGDLLIGWDFGLTPAAVICILQGAKFYVIREFTTERMYPDELIKIVSDWLNTKFKGRPIVSVCDPSGSELYLKELSNMGLPTIKSHTNDIEPRISSVNYFLNKLDGGRPAFVLSRDCNVLRKGFMGHYCYKRVKLVGEEKYRDMPDKSHPFSDIQDALQYVCLHIYRQVHNNSVKLPEFVANVATNFLEQERLRGLIYE